MIQILELIKLLGLGIVSAILFINITMADIAKTKDFIKAVEEVRQEYPEDAVERKIPSSFIATVAATETGNFNFEGAPTAKKANNFFGIHATGNQNYMETSGGARLRSFDDSKGSIRAFMQLIANDERYKNVMDGIQKNDKVENLFDGMSIYAENPNYTNILSNVYKNRIQPVFQTENFLLPKRKPITEQMDSLQ
jgi:uncharacterized FlgJ-related protein